MTQYRNTRSLSRDYKLYRTQCLSKVLLALVFAGIVAGHSRQLATTEPYRPLIGEVKAVEGAGEVKVQSSPAPETDDMSIYISQAVQEFLPTHKSESLMIMHCLAHRENGHAANRNCGDSGKACGPFQFHQPTWEGYRKLMIKEGKATEIGDRYDKKESARTTAWAIAGGRETAWGPIARDLKGSDYATCQAPSWRSK